MIDIRALKAEMVRNGYTQVALANELGMTPRTLSNKFKNGVFGSDEIEKMIVVLNLKNPLDIFFTQSVTLKDTRQGGDMN